MPANVNVTGGPGSVSGDHSGDIWANPNNNLPYIYDGSTPKTSVFKTIDVIQGASPAGSFAVATAIFAIPTGQTWTPVKSSIRFTTAGGASLQMGLTFDASGIAPGAGTLLTSAASLLCGAGGGSANVLNEGTLQQAAEYPLVGPGAVSMLFSGTVTGLAGALVSAQFRRLV